MNIQQKLQEKKQKQLAELRVIEEEIKQGKLAKTTPVAAEEIYSSLQRQPIPRAKTHAEPPAWPPAWPPPDLAHSYQNYPLLPHTCNLYPTYNEIKPDYSGPNFQDNTVQNDIKIRMPIYSQETRGFYENPANIRERVPGRSPNYLALSENRNYDSNVCSPRNVMNSSPRTAYISDVNNSNYDTSALDKTRLQNNPTIYSEDHRQSLGEFSGYCENGVQNIYSKYGETKEEYISALHNALANVQSIDNIRSIYEVGCGQYGQNCDRFPYTGGATSGATSGAASGAAGGATSGAGKKAEQRKMQRCRTPEILLAPHYLETCTRPVCCHWSAPYT